MMVAEVAEGTVVAVVVISVYIDGVNIFSSLKCILYSSKRIE